MAEYATQNAPSNLAEQLNFKCYLDNGDMPFSPNSFDIAYSKGVLNHVKNKTALFKQILSSLKPGGLLVIADWIYPTEIPNQTGPLVCETQISYEKTLTQAGFNIITYRDDSPQFITYVQVFLDNLEVQQAYIRKNFGGKLFSELKRDHEQLHQKIQQKDKIPTRILAKKQ